MIQNAQFSDIMFADDEDDELKDIENIDDAEASADNDVDLGGDDDLGVTAAKDDDNSDDS